MESPGFTPHRLSDDKDSNQLSIEVFNSKLSDRNATRWMEKINTIC